MRQRRAHVDLVRGVAVGDGARVAKELEGDRLVGLRAPHRPVHEAASARADLLPHLELRRRHPAGRRQRRGARNERVAGEARPRELRQLPEAAWQVAQPVVREADELELAALQQRVGQREQPVVGEHALAEGLEAADRGRQFLEQVVRQDEPLDGWRQRVLGDVRQPVGLEGEHVQPREAAEHGRDRLELVAEAKKDSERRETAGLRGQRREGIERDVEFRERRKLSDLRRERCEARLFEVEVCERCELACRQLPR
mmetsp:Transcript_19054/g.55023  ORF Transcript_19054/g.55023 Transcript_19054/m.55023 type:complete len:256 (-) Transcript_19054:500-1267(-)